MKNIKYIFLIISGLISAFIIAEFILHLTGYNIRLDSIKNFHNDRGGQTISDKDFFKSLYLDIYDDYYELKNDEYFIKRTNIVQGDRLKKGEKFKKIKENGVKRVFILGESVAELYDKKYLENNFKNLMPDSKFEVINAGMSAYDSYRVMLMSEEIIKKYYPDYLIVLLGNNDGVLYHPVTVNYLPYRYKIFRDSYVLNLLSDYAVSKYDFNIEQSFPFYKKNIEKIIKFAREKSKVIFVTLPQNTNMAFVEFEKNFPVSVFNGNLNDNYFDKRRNYLRTLPDKYNWVFVADFDKTLKHFAGINISFETFYDNCHYYEPLYDMMSKLIVGQIKGVDLNLDDVYFQKILNEKDKYMIKHFYNAPFYYGLYMRIAEDLYERNKSFLNKLEQNMENPKHYMQTMAMLHILIIKNNEKTALGYLDRFSLKYPDKYEIYMLKALAYHKLGNSGLTDYNFDKAKQLNGEAANLKIK